MTEDTEWTYYPTRDRVSGAVKWIAWIPGDPWTARQFWTRQEAAAYRGEDSAYPIGGRTAVDHDAR